MIYDKFFGFREEPFGVTPDPKFLYMSKKHEDALAHLKFGISERKGFVMLTGEVGSGKTTIIRYLLDHLGRDTHTSLIMNPMVDPLELLKLINHDFGVQCTGNTQKDHLNALTNFLLDAFSRSEKAVLVIDEAQEMNVECLEFIRLLSNIETNTRKLLQVILVGQPELKALVESEPLRQLGQRIAVRYHLEPLDIGDSIIYINHRLKIAGGGMVTFPVGGIRLIHRFSRGIPRLINLACDRTLLLSYSEGEIKLNAGTVKKALRDLAQEPGAIIKMAFNPKPLIIGSLIFMLILILAYSDVSHENSYLDRIGNALKAIKTDGEFFVNDGIYMTSKADMSETTCTLNLLAIWGETNIQANADIAGELEKRGYSIYSLGSDLDKAIKFNIPCILNLRHNRKDGFVVLRWVIGKEAMVIDPQEGKNIVALDSFKNNILGIKLIYKNRYNSSDRLSLAQRELKKQGLYSQPITGTLGPQTKSALTKFQGIRGIEKTGTLDDDTAVLLSGIEAEPKLTPE